jgi:hypothetical protein
MQSVFEYVISSPSYSTIGPLIESAIKYYKDDPQSSVVKISTTLELIVDDIIRKEQPVVKFRDLKGKISAINPIILPSIYNCMTQIRLLRNEGGAHPTSLSRDKTSIPADSTFALSKLYEILVWYVNFDKKRREDFLPFSEVISKLDGEKSEVMPTGDIRRRTPKLYFDAVLYSGATKHPGILETITEEKRKDIIQQYLTTEHSLETIEEIVLGYKDHEGSIAYAVIKLYKKWGLNNLWRKFVQSNGIEKSVKIIESEIDVFSDNEVEKIKEIIEFLKSIKL